MSEPAHPNWESGLDDFPDEEGIREAAKTEAMTRVAAWRFGQEMERQGLSKSRLPVMMQTTQAPKTGIQPAANISTGDKLGSRVTRRGS